MSTQNYVIGLLKNLCCSFECYVALDKPEDQWDEYDYMMNPSWIEAHRFLTEIGEIES